MKKSGAQIIIEQLCAHGVTTVFGYPGSAVLPLYDALYQNAHRISHVITAHEQGAALFVGTWGFFASSSATISCILPALPPMNA